MSTGRGPSRVHSAISTAPVSDPGTIPSRQPAGIPSSARERSITSSRRALGPEARWLRASIAPSSAASDQPGRLAQGPEEKFGLWGRRRGRRSAAGRTVQFAMFSLSLSEEKRPGGGTWPTAPLTRSRRACNRAPGRRKAGMSAIAQRRILSIQYLRAAAALAVVAHHTGWTRTELGASGVDLFFVISGFVMVHVSGRESDPRTFLLARI